MAEAPAGRILILEDDAGMARLERFRLERAGFAVDVASTADEARELLTRGGFDVMLLDYRLDGADSGLELQQDFQAEGIGIPSILVTAFPGEAVLAEAIRSGIRDFLPKNDDFLDFLVPTVERVLRRVVTERQLDEERAARAEAEAQKRALAEEDRRKDEFLAMLAHELRNPLSAIASAVEVARLDPDPEQVSWSLDVITRQAGSLSHLIDDLLDVSRIRLGKIRLRRRVLDASEVIERAIDTARPLINRKHHELTVSVSPGPLTVEADPTRLEQILVNLLTNAAKYTDEGGRIALEAGLEGREVVVRVRDTGIGIAPEMLPRVFELFAQVEGETDRSQGGLGIGLTLVQTLVRLHGGTISARSEGVGRGSEFIVRLPKAEAPAPAPKSEGAPSGPSVHRRVLVVDDNPDAARALARFLRASGHEVDVAEDGPQALEIARRLDPEVVLLDIGLPGMDGYAVARALREAGHARSLILAVSGYAQEEDRRRARESGFDDHLVKPIDHDALLVRIASSRA